MITENNAEAKVSAIVSSAFVKNLKHIPMKTGNLRYNATQLNTKGHNKFRVVIDEQIAPYAIYADTRGKSAGYWDRFFQSMAQDIIKDLGTEGNVSMSLSKAPLGGTK